MLPPLIDIGVTVGRHVQVASTFAIHPEYSQRPIVVRFRSFLGRTVILSHPVECRLYLPCEYFSVTLEFTCLGLKTRSFIDNNYTIYCNAFMFSVEVRLDLIWLMSGFSRLWRRISFCRRSSCYHRWLAPCDSREACQTYCKSCNRSRISPPPNHPFFSFLLWVPRYSLPPTGVQMVPQCNVMPTIRFWRLGNGPTTVNVYRYSDFSPKRSDTQENSYNNLLRFNVIKSVMHLLFLAESACGLDFFAEYHTVSWGSRSRGAGYATVEDCMEVCQTYCDSAESCNRSRISPPPNHVLFSFLPWAPHCSLSPIGVQIELKLTILRS